MEIFSKIAILKVSALGDFIFSLPALTALRKTFPKSEIVYLGKKWHQEFLSGRKSPIDRVVVVPPIAGVGMKETYTNKSDDLNVFLKKMRKEQFDLAIGLHGGGRFSNPLLINLGAKLTIGTKSKEAISLDRNIPYLYYQNEVFRWLEVVSLVGAKTNQIMPYIKVTAQDIALAKQQLEKDNQEFIVIHPGATDLKRRWPEENFAKVGDYFSFLGFKIIVTGSGNEKEIVEEVVNLMKYPALNLYNKLTINGLAGLLSLAELVISNDTGPLHLADALGSKSVGLYWCGNLINAAPPHIKNSVCLGSWIVNCPLCGKDCTSSFPFTDVLLKNNSCKHQISFITGITVEEVVKTASSLLNV